MILASPNIMNQTFQIYYHMLKIPTLAGEEPVENFLAIANTFKLRLTGVNHYFQGSKLGLIQSPMRLTFLPWRLKFWFSCHFGGQISL